jgi:hypothetical protein
VIILYLHIGEEEVVFFDDIVAIMDIEKTTTSNNTREFLKKSEESGIVRTVGTDIPKSFIVALTEGKQKVFLSPISSNTLKKRVAKIADDYRRNRFNV